MKEFLIKIAREILEHYEYVDFGNWCLYDISHRAEELFPEYELYINGQFKGLVRIKSGNVMIQEIRPIESIKIDVVFKDKE